MLRVLRAVKALCESVYTSSERKVWSFFVTTCQTWRYHLKEIIRKDWAPTSSSIGVLESLQSARCGLESAPLRPLGSSISRAFGVANIAVNKALACKQIGTIGGLSLPIAYTLTQSRTVWNYSAAQRLRHPGARSDRVTSVHLKSHLSIGWSLKIW